GVDNPHDVSSDVTSADQRGGVFGIEFTGVCECGSGGSDFAEGGIGGIEVTGSFVEVVGTSGGIGEAGEGNSVAGSAVVKSAHVISNAHNTYFRVIVLSLPT
ncbi:MAG: hypothetical protein Q9204_004110, partial [Flavoplaca sp. TL-2023a]